MHARALAAKVIVDVARDGRSLADVLPRAIAQLGDASERGLLQELCYGSLRNYHRLAAFANHFLHKPMKRKDDDVRALALLGIYQLTSMHVAPHAAVSRTVAACDELGKSWGKGLINALLRGFQRQPPVLDLTDEQRFNHPSWLIQALQADWPDDWAAILEANNARAPMALRVNRRKITRDDYQRVLAGAGIDSAPSPVAADALILASAVDVLQLPAFAQGHVSVQDIGAQLAAPLVELRGGERVLDACAAPGGKAAHLLELAPAPIELHALDSDAARLERVRETLDRIELPAHCIVGDAADPAGWWDNILYDRILLDAPCSATGVIRRHPDIKLLRRADDVSALADQQARLLRALWPLLKPGGRLVYATCSILKRENEWPLTEFLTANDDARERVIGAGWGRACGVGRQIFPGEAAMDGFYYARITKQSR